MISLIVGAIVGLGTLMFIIRRVRIALGENVIGDGHLLEKWKKKRQERKTSTNGGTSDVKRGLRPWRWTGWKRRK